MPAYRASHALALGALCLLAAVPSAARVWRVPAEPGAAVRALAEAPAGDTVRLEPGVHAGPLRVERPLVLCGAPGAIVDGGHHGTVVTVQSARAVVTDLQLRASGNDVMQVNAGVQVLLSEDVRLERLVLRDVLYGVVGERSNGLLVRDCDLEGRMNPRTSLEQASMESAGGNGVHLWYSAGGRVEDTRVTRFADGIYLSFAHGAHIERTLLHDNARYGLHTMYCQRGHLARSRFTRNAAGCAIMFSNQLEVVDNVFAHNQGSRTYGLLLRDCSDGVFRGNRIIDNTVGVFLDNSNRNRFEGNLLQDDGWGVLLYASCADNVFTRNDVVQCDYPVALDMRRTRNRFDDGRSGNHWSGAGGYDLDDDGVSDVEHTPVSAFSFLSKRSPDLTVLAQSPAVAALSVAERVFPALRPSDAVDRFPSVRPIPLAPDLAAPDVLTSLVEQPAARTPVGALLFAAVSAASGLALFRGGRHA